MINIKKKIKKISKPANIHKGFISTNNIQMPFHKESKINPQNLKILEILKSTLPSEVQIQSNIMTKTIKKPILSKKVPKAKISIKKIKKATKIISQNKKAIKKTSPQKLIKITPKKPIKKIIKNNAKLIVNQKLINMTKYVKNLKKLLKIIPKNKKAIKKNFSPKLIKITPKKPIKIIKNNSKPIKKIIKAIKKIKFNNLHITNIHKTKKVYPSKNVMKKKEKKNIYQYRSRASYLEKKLTMKFLLNMKFFYGPHNTPSTKLFLIGTRKNQSLINPNYLILNLRKMLKHIYLTSFHRGTIVISGFDFNMNLGAKVFYNLPTWQPGFLTNFRTLMRQTRLNRVLNRNSTRHTSQDHLYTKRIPQIPAFSIGLKTQHDQYNEASAIRIPQAITINPEFSISNYHGTYILPNKQSILPATFIIMLIRESILTAKQEEKKYFKFRTQMKIKIRNIIRKKIQLLREKIKKTSNIFHKKKFKIALKTLTDKVNKNNYNKRRIKYHPKTINNIKKPINYGLKNNNKTKSNKLSPNKYYKAATKIKNKTPNYKLFNNVTKIKPNYINKTYNINQTNNVNNNPNYNKTNKKNNQPYRNNIVKKGNIYQKNIKKKKK